MKVVKLERLVQFIRTTDELGKSQRAPLIAEVQRLVEEPLRTRLKQRVLDTADAFLDTVRGLASRFRREPKEKTYTWDEVLELMTGSWDERNMLEPQDERLLIRVFEGLHDDTFGHLMEGADYFSSDDIEELVEWVLRAIQDILAHRLALLQAKHRRLLLTASPISELINVGIIADLTHLERTKLEKACQVKKLWW